MGRKTYLMVRSLAPDISIDICGWKSRSLIGCIPTLMVIFQQRSYTYFIRNIPQTWWTIKLQKFSTTFRCLFWKRFFVMYRDQHIENEFKEKGFSVFSLSFTMCRNRIQKDNVAFKKNLHMIIKCSYNWTNGRFTGASICPHHHLPHFIDLYLPKSHAH